MKKDSTPNRVNLYEIIDDSGVDYKFLGAFMEEKPERWLGQIVEGCENNYLYDGATTVAKPFNIPGTYTAHKSNFRLIENENNH